MMADIFALIGAGIVAAALALVLRQHRPEFAMLVSIAAGAFILLRLTGLAQPVLAAIQGMLDSASLPGEYAEILLKALGICFITQIAADTCKDSGETAIASKVEMTGKIAVLAVSLPLFQQVLGVAGRLIGNE
jgi:stage III sporulation protein AD